MRPSCYDCVRKHLASAEALMAEATLGYEVHGWLAVGELVQAEHEILDVSHELATRIRFERTSYMESLNGEDPAAFYRVPTIELINLVTEAKKSQ